MKIFKFYGCGNCGADCQSWHTDSGCEKPDASLSLSDDLPDFNPLSFDYFFPDDRNGPGEENGCTK